MTNIQMLSNEGICRAMGWERVVITNEGVPVKQYGWKNDNKKTTAYNLITTPDFDNDMNAWFEWVVPWLRQQDWKIIIYCEDDDVTGVELSKNGNLGSFYKAEDKSPTIAFKKAFTELVKGE